MESRCECLNVLPHSMILKLYDGFLSLIKTGADNLVIDIMSIDRVKDAQTSTITGGRCLRQVVKDTF